MLSWEGGKINDRFTLKDCVGRTLICEKGMPIKVHSISYSHRYKDMAVINEVDPDTQLGEFIHLLSLSCQMLGYSMPTVEQKEAFSRYAANLAYEQHDPFKEKWLNTLKELRQSH